MTVASLLICPLVGALVLAYALRGLESRERRLVALGFAAHVLGAFALVAYHEHLYHGGDMFLYRLYGRGVARAVDVDFAKNAPEVVKLFFHLENALPAQVLLEGSSTGSMSAVAGALMFFMGDTLYGTCLLVSFFAFSGLVALYRGVREKLDQIERQPMLVALLLIPSTVFWTSGLVKEAVLMGFMGLLCGGVASVLVRKDVLGAIVAVIGAVGAAMVKPYALFPLALGFAAWFYGGRRYKLSLAYQLLAVGAAFAGLVLMSRLFPEYGLEKLGANMALQQHNGALVAGGAGSTVAVGDEDVTSLSGQLTHAPLGLLNAFARPLLFDVHNASTLVAAIEMTVIVGLVLSLVFKHGWTAILREVRSRPPLMFAVVFALSFGTAVGLATTNLGTLSRYRIPMMPMYLGALLILRARFAARLKKPGLVGARSRTRRLVHRAVPLTDAERDERIARLRGRRPAAR